jgi:hypothetical protein
MNYLNDYNPFQSLSVSTDKWIDLGRHWVVFYVSSRTKGEFFDSYGNSPSYYSNAFQKFFARNGLKLMYNDKKTTGLRFERVRTVLRLLLNAEM